MNEREKLITRIALSYMTANLDDVIECFVDGHSGDHGEKPDTIDYNGDIVAAPTEDEIEQLMKVLQ